MLVSILATVLAVAPTAGEPLKLAAPGLTVLNLKPELGAFLSEHLATQMKLAGAEVVTQREIASLLGMERQKQLLGCDQEATSCVAEMASALGVDAMVLGDLGKVGDKLLINLKIIASKNGKTVAVFSESIAGEDQAPDVLSRAARLLVGQASVGLGRTIATGAAPAAPSRLWALLPLGVGVVAGGVGAVSYSSSRQLYQQLASGQPKSATDGHALAAQGANAQSLGVAGMVVGGVALVAAGVLAMTLGTPSVSAAPTVSMTRDGTLLVSLEAHLP